MLAKPFAFQAVLIYNLPLRDVGFQLLQIRPLVIPYAILHKFTVNQIIFQMPVPNPTWSFIVPIIDLCIGEIGFGLEGLLLCCLFGVQLIGWIGRGGGFAQYLGS